MTTSNDWCQYSLILLSCVRYQRTDGVAYRCIVTNMFTYRDLIVSPNTHIIHPSSSALDLPLEMEALVKCWWGQVEGHPQVTTGVIGYKRLLAIFLWCGTKYETCGRGKTCYILCGMRKCNGWKNVGEVLFLTVFSYQYSEKRTCPNEKVHVGHTMYT